MNYPADAAERLEKTLRFEVHGYTTVRSLDLYKLLLWAKAKQYEDSYLAQKEVAAHG